MSPRLQGGLEQPEPEPLPDALEGLLARWRAYNDHVSRHYNGIAFLYGEAAARKWLDEQPPFDSSDPEPNA